MLFYGAMVIIDVFSRLRDSLRYYAYAILQREAIIIHHSTLNTANAKWRCCRITRSLILIVMRHDDARCYASVALTLPPVSRRC